MRLINHWDPAIRFGMHIHYRLKKWLDPLSALKGKGEERFKRNYLLITLAKMEHTREIMRPYSWESRLQQIKYFLTAS